MTQSGLEAEMAFNMRAVGLPAPETEHRFDPGCCLRRGQRAHLLPLGHAYRPARRWRLDFAWPALMLALEVEGGVGGKSRHTSRDGFERDAEKYDAAAKLGWRVLRVTGAQVRDGRALATVERALKEAAK